jgi:protocatechuate 3,4-dioxygenase beta subunit
MTEKDLLGNSLLSRRDVIAVAAVVGTSWFLGGTSADAEVVTDPAKSLCVVRPEQTEGPYFIDERLNRSDIRSDPTTGQVSRGTPLTLTVQVMRLNGGECYPLSSALVDIWHCDARGVYSDVEDPGFNTIGQKFLRGCQVTDAQGAARFLTVYPGWYPIRTVHIHFKIRTEPAARRSYEFTSQVYFPDVLTDRVHAATPYASMGPRRVRNQRDFIFRDGGDQLLLQPSATQGGYSASFTIALRFP